MTLAAGARSITAKAIDAAGNVSAASSALAVTVDATGPAAPTGLDLAAADDTGSSNSDNVTSKTSALTITGQAEANARIELFDGTTSLGTTTANASGAFSLDVTLAAGVRAITAKATNAAGNVSAASAALAVTIDATGPAAPTSLDLITADDNGASSTDNLTNKQSVTITGTAEVGAIVELFDGTTSLGTTTANASGAFSFTVTLADGAHAITAKATDASGNASAASTALAITVDGTAPAAPTGLDLAAADDTGSSNSDNVTSQTSGLTITGQAEANARIELFDGTTSLGTTTSDANGAFSLDVTLAAGARSITAKAIDAAGNVGAASAALAITVDTTAPAAPTGSGGIPAIQLSAIASGTGGFVMNGAAAADNSGISVSSAGDVNNDGYDDLIIGAPNADPNGIQNAGAVYVVFGKANTTAVNLSDIGSGTGGFVINGISVGDFSGRSVSSAGDVNKDGYDDLIVAAPDADPNGLDSGAIYVVFGKANGASVNLSDIASGTGNLGFAIYGASASDFSGDSVSSVGDLNKDGYDDLIVGVPKADPNGLDSGASYVVFGKANATSVNLSDIASGTGNLGFAIYGASADDRSGISVSSAGDVNGDGINDLIIGAYLADPNGSNSGASYVVFGKANGTPVNLSDIVSGTGGFLINGAAANDRSGRSVSSAGDVNNDGFDDLIVGASFADPNGSSSGASYVVFGKANGTQVNLSDIASGTGGFVINGASANDFSGGSVSSAGDVNGDGFDDLIVGASGVDLNGKLNAGASYVVFGKASTTAVNLSVIASGTGNLGIAINGALANDLSGASVSSAGDVNGDGFDDLIIGANSADPNGLNGAGASYVVFGGNFTASVTQVGTTGNDTLSGTAGNDVIFGGLGNDVITTNGGNDRIAGGPGADTFKISDGPGTIRILDFGEGDTLDLSAFGLSGRPTFTQSGSGDTQIQLDADTFVIVEGYVPAQLSDFLTSTPSSLIVL